LTTDENKKNQTSYPKSGNVTYAFGRDYSLNKLHYLGT